MFCKKDKNRIKGKGCKYLSQGNWPLLSEIHLSKNTLEKGSNSIGTKGMHYLSKAFWKKMKTFYMCTFDVILGEIGLSKGCFWLKRCNWNELTRLWLGIFLMIKMTMISKKRNVSIWLKSRVVKFQ